MSRRRRGSGRGGKPSPAADLLPDIAVPDPAVPRRLRVERDIHEQLATALRQMRDPRLSAVSITRVQLTDDLQFARVFVRLGVAAEVDSKELMRGLRSAGGRLRTHVSSKLALRRTPVLRFIYDTGVDAAERVEELLAEIRDESSEPGA